MNFFKVVFLRRRYSMTHKASAHMASSAYHTWNI